MKYFWFILFLFIVLTIIFFIKQPLQQNNKTLHFTNIQAQSGIDFHQDIVDDSGKYRKMVHYGHGSGIAAADVDSDGLIDVFFVNQKGASKLYKNLGNGKFENITKQSNINTSDRVSIGASFADYDNDGDQDLFVTAIRKGTLLFNNNGSGVFSDVTQTANVEYYGHPSTGVWLDYNNDGFLDLLLVSVGSFTNPDPDIEKKLGYFEGIPDAFLQQLKVPGEQPILWQNNKNGTFTKVSKNMNLNITDWVGAAATTDFNHDNFPDLYITSMAGEDHFFKNNEGKFFQEVTKEFFPRTSYGSMGAKFFDYNNDGNFDLFVTDMHSDMLSDSSMHNPSKKLTQGDLSGTDMDFFDSLGGFDDKKYIYGNSFFQNSCCEENNNYFTETSDELGVETLWPWGISTGDIDADGYEDIFLASGMGNEFDYQPNILLHNENGNSFTQKQNQYGIEPRLEGNSIKKFFTTDGGKDMPGTKSSRSSVIFDMDNDGDLDIITNEFGDYPLILENNLTKVKKIQFVEVFLEGTKSNRNGLGSTIIAEDNKNRKQYRYVDGNSGYFGFSQLPQYFAIPKESSFSKMIVNWPSGIKQEVDLSGYKNIISIKEPNQ